MIWETQFVRGALNAVLNLILQLDVLKWSWTKPQTQIDSRGTLLSDKYVRSFSWITRLKDAYWVSEIQINASQFCQVLWKNKTVLILSKYLDEQRGIDQSRNVFRFLVLFVNKAGATGSWLKVNSSLPAGSTKTALNKAKGQPVLKSDF